MTKKHSALNQTSYVFQLEVMVDAEHNASALEQLIHKLNECGLADYRILSGIRLGELIDSKKNHYVAETVSVHLAAEPDKTAEQPAPPIHEEQSDGLEPLRQLMKSNALIRLIINRGLGIKLSIPCRIINIDEAQQLITVYHVDEKQVYTFRLNEIEDYIQ